jgi:hypothetical protein
VQGKKDKIRKDVGEMYANFGPQFGATAMFCNNEMKCCGSE